MRCMLYTTVPIGLIFTQCAGMPLILHDAEIAVEAVEVGLEAEEVYVEKVNKEQVKK